MIFILLKMGVTESVTYLCQSSLFLLLAGLKSIKSFAEKYMAPIKKNLAILWKTSQVCLDESRICSITRVLGTLVLIFFFDCHIHFLNLAVMLLCGIGLVESKMAIP